MAKKIVCVLMMVLMVTGLVFATDPATLKLNAGVAEVLQHKFATTGATTVDGFGSLTEKTVVGGLDLANYQTAQSLDVFYNFYTNLSSTVTIEATATPFSATGIETKVGYMLIVGENSTLVDKDNAMTSLTSFLADQEAPLVGSRVLNTEFKSVRMTEADAKAAVASDDYSATITITVTNA